MKVISEQDFHDNPSEVFDAVEAGETYVVTREGGEVLELRLPPRRQSLSTAEVIELVKDLPPVDYAKMRADIDEFFGNEDRIGDDDPWERRRG
ncbi:PhdYeFM domain-containing protein [Actinosynnema sp. NPDC051121]|nr:PhdYeFM domain-containing protein [Saccharothrix sp.]